MKSENQKVLYVFKVEGIDVYNRKLFFLIEMVAKKDADFTRDTPALKGDISSDRIITFYTPSQV